MASAIILAAGIGQRMKSPVPKQYMDLAGLPVLSRTLNVFDDHPDVQTIFLVVAAEEIDFCRETILSTRAWKSRVELIAGGKQRQDSVYEGLKAVDGQTDDDIVLIHDGVRPFVSLKLITSCIDGAIETGACIPGVPASDTLKRVDAKGIVSGTVSRENIWLAQTPQAFSLKLILAGFEKALKRGLCFTDDAAVIEHGGGTVRVIPGSRRNIKITTPEDLDFALALLRTNVKEGQV